MGNSLHVLFTTTHDQLSPSEAKACVEKKTEVMLLLVIANQERFLQRWELDFVQDYGIVDRLEGFWGGRK